MADKNQDKNQDTEEKATPTAEEESAQTAETPEATDETVEKAEERIVDEDVSGEDISAEDVSGEQVAAEAESLEELSAPSNEEKSASEEKPAEDSKKEVGHVPDEPPHIAAPKSTGSPTLVTVDEVDGQVEGIAAFFDHPKHLLAAAEHARDAEYKDFDALSPFPIHGMDDALGLGRSWIPWVTFSAGAVGFLSANAMEFGMMTFDWPMIIGGKAFAPWPSFVPVMFELTVLIAGVTTVFTMLKAAGCFKKPLIIDPRITDDRFVLWISAKDKKFEVNEAIAFMETLNPLEIRKIVKDA